MIEVGDRVIFVGLRSELPRQFRRMPDSRLYKPASVVAKGSLFRNREESYYYVLAWDDLKANSSYYGEYYFYQNGTGSYVRGVLVKNPYIIKAPDMSPVYTKLLLRR